MLPYAAQGCDNTVKTKIDVLFCFVLFCFVLIVCLFVCLSSEAIYSNSPSKSKKERISNVTHRNRCMSSIALFVIRILQSVLFNFVPYTT